MNTNSNVVLIDLDGVVWRSDTPIKGSAEAIAALRDAGHRVAFFTNNSYVASGEVLAKLARQGIGVDSNDLLTSAQAAATLLHAGERALIVGGEGSREALAAAGVETEFCDGAGETKGFDAVVVGLDPKFDYACLTQAMHAIEQGARLIGTNADATWPTSEGELPGGGAVLAAVATAGGTEPEVAGKPHTPAAALVQKRLGKVALMIGDRPATDGKFAERLGASFGLVLSGTTPPGHGPLDPAPDLEAADLAALVPAWISARAEITG